MKGWKTVNVKDWILDDVEEVLQTKSMQKEGITNVSQFVTAAIREKIQTIEMVRLNHVDTYKDHVDILDNDLTGKDRVVSVYFKKRQSWCTHCEDDACIHIQYAWEVPEVRKTLHFNRILPPPSRTSR